MAKLCYVSNTLKYAIFEIDLPKLGRLIAVGTPQVYENNSFNCRRIHAQGNNVATQALYVAVSVMLFCITHHPSHHTRIVRLLFSGLQAVAPRITGFCIEVTPEKQHRGTTPPIPGKWRHMALDRTMTASG
ncbi:hypothetical protein J4Q44_G00180120 [Coregonus suidteri]|uniref:Uncharacterized protein n=1 Tax=Coregonus suidteri TaxID=861788 RepID=A0AAN8QVG1_9TELE